MLRTQEHWIARERRITTMFVVALMMLVGLLSFQLSAATQGDGGNKAANLTRPPYMSDEASGRQALTTNTSTDVDTTALTQDVYHTIVCTSTTWLDFSDAASTAVKNTDFYLPAEYIWGFVSGGPDDIDFISAIADTVAGTCIVEEYQ